jgi:PHP family Zn ribbon phosphoesterase
MGVHCDDLVKIVKSADENAEVIPAHAWTPHFGVFGSLSGFNSIEEAFGDQAKYIRAIETGLSSDPKMNWQISGLDKYSLTSNSDAHSLRKIGREANVFEIAEDKLSFAEIISALYSKDPARFLYTIEFFPEEGKYHLDGHADCKFSCQPSQTKKLKGVCPVCGKKLLVGVLNRVDELADRQLGFAPQRYIPFKSVIPLEEIIAETFGVGTQSKKVLAMYEKMISHTTPSAVADTPPILGGEAPNFAKASSGEPRLSSDDTRSSPPGTGGVPREARGGGRFYGEFGILLEMLEDQIADLSSPEIAQSILRVREGKVTLEGGYDGVFGKIHIYSDKEREKLSNKPRQNSLF